MKTEKEKLQAKTVDQLKRYAKKVGAKIVTPEGKAKTKEQLVNSIVIAERLGKKSAASKSKKAPVRKTLAAKPKSLKAGSRLLTVDNGRMTVEEALKVVNHKGPVSWKPTAHNKKAVKNQIDSILKKLRAEYNATVKPVK
jgi:hypothetical protein